MTSFKKDAKDEIEQILDNFPTREAALVPLFHLAYKYYGRIEQSLLTEISTIVNLSFEHVNKSFKQYQLFWPDRKE